MGSMRLNSGFLCNPHLHAPYLEEKRPAARSLRRLKRLRAASQAGGGASVRKM